MGNTYVLTKDGVVRESDAAGEYIRVISTYEELEELIERIPHMSF